MLGFIGFVPGEKSDIYLANSLDGTTKNVTDDDESRGDLALGPDAKVIVYVKQSFGLDGEGDELRILDLDSGADVLVFRATWELAGE